MVITLLSVSTTLQEYACKMNKAIDLILFNIDTPMHSY